MNKSDDMISRQAAIDVIKKWKRYDTVDRLIERINILPAAESERKTGRWIYGEHDVAMCDGYWCDKCGFFVPWDYKHKFIDFINDYHFCPSCGARMAERRKE